MTPVDTIHAAFQDLRADTDPRGHELLTALEELCVEAVDASRTIAAHVAALQHEKRLGELIAAYTYGSQPTHPKHLRAVEKESA